MQKDQPSRTACKVALNLVTLGATPETLRTLPPGVVEATAQLLVASGAVPPALVRWSRTPQVAFLYQAWDMLMPGEFEGLGHRKAFCEAKARQSLDAGCTQVLVLGAGYDTLAWRLTPEFSEARFFEIDHPATAHLKAKGITAMGGRDNLYLIQEDLAQTQLVSLLAATESWDPTAPTVIIAEGLLMYLPREAVLSLFAQCAAVTGPGSRMVFTYVGTGMDGTPDLGWLSGPMKWAMALTDEPWLWGIRPDELGGFLEGTGWTLAPRSSGQPVQHGVEYYGVAIK